MKVLQSWGVKSPIEDVIEFRSALVKGEFGPYVVTAFLICWM